MSRTKPARITKPAAPLIETGTSANVSDPSIGTPARATPAFRSITVDVMTGPDNMQCIAAVGQVMDYYSDLPENQRHAIALWFRNTYGLPYQPANSGGDRGWVEPP